MAPMWALHDGAHDACHRGEHGESCHAREGTRHGCHVSVQLPRCRPGDQRPARQHYEPLDDPRQGKPRAPHDLSQQEGGPRIQDSKASS